MRSTLLTIFVLSAGCATTKPHAMPEPEARQSIVDVESGELLATSKAARFLGARKHVYVGEQHGSAVHHGVQLQVLKALAATGRPLAIGIEWLPAEVQPTLDRWMSGRIDEEAFLHQSEWKRRWGHAYKHYRAILRWARAKQVPVWALNAPSGLSRAVVRHGPEGVPLSLKPHLPPLNTGNKAHRAYFRSMMMRAAHGHGQGQGHGQGHGKKRRAPSLERYYLAQLVWDESMSIHLAQHMRSPQGRGRTAVVFAGIGHIDHGHGVPLRARKLLGEDFAIVLPIAHGSAHEYGRLLGKTRYPEKRADLLWEARPPTQTVKFQALMTSMRGRR